MTGPLPPADLSHVVSGAEDALRSLRGGRVLITGASGFVGSWMLESLVHANRTLGLGASFAALTRNRARFAAMHSHLVADASVQMIVGDVRFFDLPAGDVTHVIHAASAATPTENASDPDRVITIIEDGTRHVLDVAAARGATRLLLVSSGSVYARRGDDPPLLDETHPTLIAGATTAERFGVAKRNAERATESASVPSINARIFGLVGPRIPIHGQFAVGQFLGDALAGVSVHVHGDGSSVRSYLHAADLAVWGVTLLVRGPAGRAYNVGSDAPVAIGDVARAVADLADPALEVTFGAGPVPDPRAHRYVPSIARARAELGLEPRIGMDDALRRTWVWLVERGP